MRFLTTAVVAFSFGLGFSALADDYDQNWQDNPGEPIPEYTQEPGQAEPFEDPLPPPPSENIGEPGVAAPQDLSATPFSIAEGEPAARGTLQQEIVGFRPQVGLLSYEDRTGSRRDRLVFGALAQLNVMKVIRPSLMEGEREGLYVGPETGILFSHLGSDDSNFLGLKGVVPTNLGSNLLLVPLNIRVGYLLSNNLRIGGHGGGVFTLRSIANAVNFGDTATAGQDSSLKFYPNVGADLDFSFSKSVSFTVRPDLTITPGADVFTGTLAFAFALSEVNG